MTIAAVLVLLICLVGCREQTQTVRVTDDLGVDFPTEDTGSDASATDSAFDGFDPTEQRCDLFAADDCPDGKCMPSIDGVNACVPAGQRPIGGGCGESPIDPCVRGAICARDPGLPGDPVCRRLCRTSEDLLCGPGRTCSGDLVIAAGSIGACRLESDALDCEPLTDCALGLRCLPRADGTTYCADTIGAVPVGDACSWSGQCAGFSVCWEKTCRAVCALGARSCPAGRRCEGLLGERTDVGLCLP